MDLALVMTDEKDTGSIFSHRNRSFGRKGKDSSHQHRSLGGHSRSLSWSVPHNWSPSKQLQLITNNLITRGNEIEATDGLATLFFTMSFILMFVLWVPCCGDPLSGPRRADSFHSPSKFSMDYTVLLLHRRVMDESKKRDRRNSNGLLKEIHQIEKNVHQITALVDSAQFPLSEEVKEEARANEHELSLVCEACKKGLDPLQRQLRDVF